MPLLVQKVLEVNTGKLVLKQWIGTWIKDEALKVFSTAVWRSKMYLNFTENHFNLVYFLYGFSFQLKGWQTILCQNYSLRNVYHNNIQECKFDVFEPWHSSVRKAPGKPHSLSKDRARPDQSKKAYEQRLNFSLPRTQFEFLNTCVRSSLASQYIWEFLYFKQKNGILIGEFIYSEYPFIARTSLKSFQVSRKTCFDLSDLGQAHLGQIDPFCEERQVSTHRPPFILFSLCFLSSFLCYIHIIVEEKSL